MKTAAPLGLIAWQLVLSQAVRAMHRYDDNLHTLSNIELLVPLTVSDDVASVESDVSDTGERYDRARPDKDMPFSNIPASEFVLDENVPVFEKKKRGHKHSRKQDFAYRPRSVYLESVSSGESDERDERSELGELSAQVWHACRRLTRSPAAGRQHELLLLLCSELLDGSPAPPAPPTPLFAPPTPPHAPDCPCCPASGAPVWPRGLPGPAGPARRELVPIGEDPYMVKSYMRSRARKRHYGMPDSASEYLPTRNHWD